MIIKRNNPFGTCELKFSKAGTGEFEGYASVFDGVDSYQDTIEKGAFAKSIKSGKTIPMFINHDSWAIPAGKYISLKEDDTGLLVVGKIDLNHKDGPSLYSAMKEETMDGLSIGFRIRKGGAYEDEDTGVRVITDIDLKEISAVNFPADDAARISMVKSEIETLETLKDFELFLRDSANFSKSAATAFVSRIRKLKQGDPAADDEITELKARIVRENTNHLIDVIRKL